MHTVSVLLLPLLLKHEQYGILWMALDIDSEHILPDHNKTIHFVASIICAMVQ